MKTIWIFLKCMSLFWCLCRGNLENNVTENYPGLEDSVEGLNETEISCEDCDGDFLLDEPLGFTLKFATPCETPNGEVAYCVKINDCPVLKNVKNKLKYAGYVTASRCGPSNEDQKNFKVCCGKYNNFRNVSDSIVSAQDDQEIFPKQCGTQQIIVRGRIYGGTKAALKEYPWMARIIHRNNKGRRTYGCSGFLIHAKYIVTAGHCVKSPTMSVRGNPQTVVLGEYDIRTKIDCSEGNTTCAELPQKRGIEDIVVHPEYDMYSKDHHNDIALIHLKSSVKFSDFVQPICLVAEPSEVIRKFYISGWGKTQTEEASPVKLKVDLPFVNRTECEEKMKMFGLEVVESQICAGGEKGKDSCTGDSGGPLMVRKEDGTHYAAGLVSYGIGCGMKGWPGVYTNISSYINWITTEILRLGISDRQAKLIKRLRNKQKKTSENVTIN